jgi:hypothetical protein
MNLKIKNMKNLFRRFLLLAMIGGAVSFVGCKDDEEEEIKPVAPVVSVCGTGNFCMNYGGVQKTGNATFKALANGRNRIYWENSSSGSFEQVELDIYGSALGDYTIDTTGAVGTANIQYAATGVGSDDALTGKVTITAFDPAGAGVTGTFSGTTEKGKEIKDGKFSNVK